MRALARRLDALAITDVVLQWIGRSHVVIEPGNEYFGLIRNRWSEALIQAFRDLPDPDWL